MTSVDDRRDCLRLSSTILARLRPLTTRLAAGLTTVIIFVPVASAAAVADGIDYDSVHNIHIYYGDFGR